MSTERETMEKLVRLSGQVSEGAQRFYNEEGWNPADPAFHRFNRSSAVVRQVLVLNFLDYLVGDCGIIKAFSQVHPDHSDWFFTTASEGFRALGLEEKARAAAAIVVWVGAHRELVARYFIASEKYLESTEEEEEAFESMADSIEHELMSYEVQLEQDEAVNQRLCELIEKHWQELDRELNFANQ
ncbi:MAG TPA: hypothetical protein VMB21_20465 [Candidatus Limnocylindria bacterium]|jgi:hypothetical protein|nr:hypothetical protein [Candidatus Limnocylindria bacterium]